MFLFLKRWGAGGWGIARANPFLTLVVVIVLVAVVSVWVAERRAHEATRQLAKQHEAQYQETIRVSEQSVKQTRAQMTQKAKELERKAKELERLTREKGVLVVSSEQDRAKIPALEAAGVKRREVLASLQGQQLEAEFRRRGFQGRWVP